MNRRLNGRRVQRFYGYVSLEMSRSILDVRSRVKGRSFVSSNIDCGEL